jgi:hypothetical protein
MWRWSFFGVHELCVDLKPQFAFQQWNRRSSWNKKLKKAPIWMSLMSESHWWHLFHNEVKSWDYNLVKKLTIPNPGWKAVSSNASLGLTVRLLVGDIVGFMKKGVNTLLTASMLPLDTHLFSIFTSIVYDGAWVTSIKTQKLRSNEEYISFDQKRQTG